MTQAPAPSTTIVAPPMRTMHGSARVSISISISFEGSLAAQWTADAPRGDLDRHHEDRQLQRDRRPARQLREQLRAQLQWTSDLDGAIGSGASFSSSALQIGAHTVTASVTDGGGAQGSAAVSITVLDVTPPVIAQPANLVVEQQGASGSIVSFATPSATDAVDANPTIANNAPATFGLGATVVTFTATDASGNSASGSMTVTIQDTTAPGISTPGNLTVQDTDGSGDEVVTSSLGGSATKAFRFR